jgi:hypothetical protein
MEETLRTVTDNWRKTAGLQIGRAAAAAILKARENDRCESDRAIHPGYKARRILSDAAGFYAGIQAELGRRNAMCGNVVRSVSPTRAFSGEQS